MSVRLFWWCLAHPRWRPAAVAAGAVQMLAIFAVCTAPRACAATNTELLNFTGLHDTYGVPIGDYYLSLASIPEPIMQGGPGVGVNPASWMRWTMHAMTLFATYFTQSTILTAEAGAFIGIIALALWVMKLTVSTYWLTVISEIARAIAGAVMQVTTELGLLLLAIPIGVFCGVVTVRRGEAGRGWTMILIALTMPALSIAVFADPAGEMYGPDGLLAFGRRAGFSVAEAAVRNGSLGGAGYGDQAGGQIDSLTASLITHTVREPLQLWNFGHVVDRVGGCGAAWTLAVRAGVPDGPLHAMGACGDRAAMLYAARLDGSNIWVGLVFVVAALLLGFFMMVSGWAVLKVSVQAIWTTVMLLPCLWLGSIPGAPQRRAVDVAWQFFRHGVEVLVYIVYVGVIGLAIERLVSRPLPAELGGTNPLAHVLIMGAAAVAAFILLRHIRADLSGRPPGRGLITRGADVAVGMGMHAAFGTAGSAAVKGAAGVWRRWRTRGEQTPWEQLDAGADNARQVHGDPQSGFNPVPQGGDGDEGAASAGAPGGALLAGPGGGASGAASDGADAPTRSRRGRGRPAPQVAHDGDSGAPSGGHGGPAGGAAADAPSVPSVIDSLASGHRTDVPIPPPGEPPPDDEPAPPPDDAGPRWTTVNPITET
jgi:hypothetical protein